MPDQFVLGMDFGTLSVRALVVNTENGTQAGMAEERYDVLDRALPDGTPLPDGFALAVPAQYVRAMTGAVRCALAQAGAVGRQVVAVGLDCTSATVLPTDKRGTPLCELPAWQNRPNAYAKLWKHHGAYRYGRRMQQAALMRGESWLPRVGGNVQCELLLPKALETALDDPELWENTDRYLEMGDWLTYVLTGSTDRSRVMAACNGYYLPPDGYPNAAYWQAVAPGADSLLSRLKGELVGLERPVGTLKKDMALALGLCEGTLVAPALIDSHASVLGCGADQPGDLVAVMGTSACYLMNDTVRRDIPGIYSCAWEGNVPGLFGYEGGQSCVGDGLNWVVENVTPARAEREAAREGMSVHAWLTREAARLVPGESGLMALDWLNGVRTPLMRPELKCVVTGLTLRTTCAHIYRAALESCCYGARRVLDCYRAGGLPPRRFFAAGGISGKNRLFMQILSDVCGMEIKTAKSAQTGALGAAIAAACVSGRCGTLSECVRHMASPFENVYTPSSSQAYEALYQEYIRLYGAFSDSADSANQ